MTKWEENKKIKYGYTWNAVWDNISEVAKGTKIWEPIAIATYRPMADNDLRLAMRDIFGFNELR